MSFVVFVDGSGTTSGPAGIGFIAYEEGVESSEGSLPLRRATNQQAELLAAAYGLDALPERQVVLVVSDSEYVVKGFTQWLPRWVERGWRTSTGKSVSNQPYWERLIKAVDRHAEVHFQWTRGHVGNAGNERADTLAGLARRAAIEQAAA